ncbi:hypothetical protein DSO57_1002407 [Entomophthora muscae]|uniref:Uncharacterized protein n=1 Tax=Entomophthora muscae TaxID=34485 RepID=A0ACC2SAI5_9FUNG|nr:hypothetical protein DSO57_1002407 [Entomophthora muscae]
MNCLLALIVSAVAANQPENPHVVCINACYYTPEIYHGGQEKIIACYQACGEKYLSKPVTYTLTPSIPTPNTTTVYPTASINTTTAHPTASLNTTISTTYPTASLNTSISTTNPTASLNTSISDVLPTANVTEIDTLIPTSTAPKATSKVSATTTSNHGLKSAISVILVAASAGFLYMC